MNFAPGAFCWGFGATAAAGQLRACRDLAEAGSWPSAWFAALAATILAVMLLSALLRPAWPTAAQLGRALFPPPRS